MFNCPVCGKELVDGTGLRHAYHEHPDALPDGYVDCLLTLDPKYWGDYFALADKEG